MGKQCCVYNCSQTFEKNSSISFHAFPRDPARREVWTLNLRRKNFVPSDYTRICSNHFTEDCFDREKFGGRWLKPTAVPTLFNNTLNQDSKETSIKPKKMVQAEHPLLKKQQICANEDQTHLSETVKTAKRKRLSYLGDFKSGVANSPDELKKRWEIAERVIHTQKKKICRLQKRQKRLEKKVADLSSMLQEIKQNDDKAKDMPEIPGVAGELLKRVSNNILKDKYSPELQCFALKLHHFSPRAYDYVRKVFNTCLPHPSTLRKWYAIEKGKPELTAEALNSLNASQQLVAVNSLGPALTGREVCKQNQTNTLGVNESLSSVSDIGQKATCNLKDKQNKTMDSFEELMAVSINNQEAVYTLVDKQNDVINSLGINDKIVVINDRGQVGTTSRMTDNQNECGVVLTEL